MICIIPNRCEECIHLKYRKDGDVLIMDRCEAYDREITDEMLNEPCPLRRKWYWSPREVKE